jgi:2-polyprenyl-3-methyl-5-hydroxy-6-metoxy-1,4-benzoquinol methylase
MARDKNTELRLTTSGAQEDYFSELARKRGKNESDNVDKFGEIAQLLRPSHTHPKVLECGAGTGLYTHHLLRLGYQVTAVDLSADALAVNRRIAEAAGFGTALRVSHGDFVEIGSALSDEYDQVVFIKVLHHFADLDRIEAALAVAAKRIGINGQVTLFEPNGRNPLWRLYYTIARDRVTGRSKWAYEKNTALIREGNLRERLPPGVSAVFRYHYFIPAYLVMKTGFLRPLVERLNALLGRSGLARWSANLSCTLTRTG